jgi:hypothetical protein
VIVPKRVDLVILKGMPWDASFTWELLGVPAPLAGHTGQMRLVSADSSATLYTPATTANGKVTLTDPGVIAINLLAADTNALPLGLYEWSYRDIDAGSVPSTVMRGRAQVELVA